MHSGTLKLKQLNGIQQTLIFIYVIIYLYLSFFYYGMLNKMCSQKIYKYILNLLELK